jgi:3-oxoacyl-[acyl-carrier-protein] synthase II
MYSKRIVITGLGAITPLGNNVPAFWESLIAARSGVAPVRAFPAEGFHPSYAAEVKDFTAERANLPRKRLKMMGRQAQLVFAAVDEACVDSRLTTDRPVELHSRVGIILGVGMMDPDVMELGRAFHATAHAQPQSASVDRNDDTFDPVAFGQAGSPHLFPLGMLRNIPNLAAAHSSIALDAQGPSNTLTTGCVSAANAIGEAARVIARGDADVLVAGGTDARVSPLGMLRYRGLGWMATRADVDPAEVSAPFDASAAGFVNGEGAGVVVLESLEHAQRRGVRIYAELAGYGAANDAYDVLLPHPKGRALTRATMLCLDRSGLNQDSTHAVFAPAASIPAFDRAVAASLATVFGAAAQQPAITATRSLLGHTHAASAALDCIAAVKAIGESRLPPTINLKRPIAPLRFVQDTAMETEVSAALVSAYGFGGHAAVLALRRYVA